MFIEKISGVVLDKITDRMETAGYDDNDIMAVRAVAFHSGVNGNGAIIDVDDAQRAVYTLVGKPVKILFDGENPTGHGMDRSTGKFSPAVARIGFIHYAWLEIDPDDNTKYEAIVELVIWRKEYPEISNRMRELHRDGELFFSIEAERDFEVTPEGNRRCFNITFNGLAVVQTPAWSQSRSLMVAEIINKGGTEMKEIMELIGNLNDKIGTEIAEQFKNHLGTITGQITSLETEKAELEGTVTSLRGEVAEKDGAIKTLEAERDSYKNVVETAEKERLGKERLEKLSKYGDVEKTADELASLTKEEFVEVLEKAVEGFDAEIAELRSHGTPFFNVNKEKVDRKKELLSLMTGLGA